MGHIYQFIIIGVNFCVQHGAPRVRTWYKMTVIFLYEQYCRCIFSYNPLKLKRKAITHWGWMTHICVTKKISIIASHNGLSAGLHQAIIWTNAAMLLIWTLGTNISEIWNKIHTILFKKMHLKMSSVKWCLFRLGLTESMVLVEAACWVSTIEYL